MRSSPVSADSSLELPRVTAADMAAGALVALATAFLAWAVVRSDGWSKTAVLLIEYQNEFATEGGVLHGAVAEVMKRKLWFDRARCIGAAGHRCNNPERNSR